MDEVRNAMRPGAWPARVVASILAIRGCGRAAAQAINPLIKIISIVAMLLVPLL